MSCSEDFLLIYCNFKRIWLPVNIFGLPFSPQNLFVEMDIALEKSDTESIFFGR